jgi:hypothetical protein
VIYIQVAIGVHKIVVLYPDDWRHDSLHWQERSTIPYVRTPFLDELAEKGVRFSKNCVTTSICWVSCNWSVEPPCEPVSTQADIKAGRSSRLCSTTSGTRPIQTIITTLPECTTERIGTRRTVRNRGAAAMQGRDMRYLDLGRPSERRRQEFYYEHISQYGVSYL